MNQKKEQFKLFVRANPFLITYIRDGKKTWQELFELYDICGEDSECWNKYLDSSDDTSNSNNNLSNYVEELIKKAKNIDIDKVQEGITSLQKTLSLFGDLFVKKGVEDSYNPRPLYKRFED